MSILIKGLKMPKKGECIDIVILDDGTVVYYDDDKKIGEAVELPDHGDLIDRSALMKEFAEYVAPSNRSDFVPPPNWNDAVSLLGSAPTVIPAERE